MHGMDQQSWRREGREGADGAAGVPLRRRSALTLGAGALTIVAAGCGGRSSTSASGGAPSGSSSGAGSSSASTPSPTSAPFEGWGVPADLKETLPDLKAIDARTRIAPGNFDRRDRYGSWKSPGFDQDRSTVFTSKPLAIDPSVRSALGRDPDGVARAVLVQTILQILDTELLFEKDNSRHTEVGPALVKAFALNGISPHAFDAVFEQAPLSGAPGGEMSSLESMFGITPAPYVAGRPRMHLLGHATRIDRMRTVKAEGPLVIASAAGAFPARREGKPLLLHRQVSYALGLGSGDSVLMSSFIGTGGVTRWLADAKQIPEVPRPTTTPQGWAAQSLGRLTVSLPSIGGAEPRRTELALAMGDPAEGRSIVMGKHLVPEVPAPPFPSRTSSTSREFRSPGPSSSSRASTMWTRGRRSSRCSSSRCMPGSTSCTGSPSAAWSGRRRRRRSRGSSRASS